eukprot:TRINITY_DN475_c0_g1_i1.p1 TRINITY_DN475_c0_g1~~TRINITY_DN475_c0_g1_i1.p1  ORF type:complete len:231 (-),score=78.19 TRINITY_DN475_c0_g1_i1:297-989(-)
MNIVLEYIISFFAFLVCIWVAVFCVKRYCRRPRIAHHLDEEERAFRIQLERRNDPDLHLTGEATALQNDPTNFTGGGGGAVGGGSGGGGPLGLSLNLGNGENELTANEIEQLQLLTTTIVGQSDNEPHDTTVSSMMGDSASMIDLGTGDDNDNIMFSSNFITNTNTGSNSSSSDSNSNSNIIIINNNNNNNNGNDTNTSYTDDSIATPSASSLSSSSSSSSSSLSASSVS